MTVFTEPNNLKDFLVWEEDRDYSRDQITIASGNSVSLGEVLGQITASGKYVPVNAGASDGSETAAGIAIADYDAASADVKGVAIVREAIITTSNLVWPDGATSNQKAAWLENLAVEGIITREES